MIVDEVKRRLSWTSGRAIDTLDTLLDINSLIIFVLTPISLPIKINIHKLKYSWN